MVGTRVSISKCSHLEKCTVLALNLESLKTLFLETQNCGHGVELIWPQQRWGVGCVDCIASQFTMDTGRYGQRVLVISCDKYMWRAVVSPNRKNSVNPIELPQMISYDGVPPVTCHYIRRSALTWTIPGWDTQKASPSPGISNGLDYTLRSYEKRFFPILLKCFSSYK